MLRFIFNQYAVEDEDNLDLILEGKAQFSLRLNLFKLRNFIDLGHGLSSKENKLSFCLGSRWRCGIPRWRYEFLKDRLLRKWILGEALTELDSHVNENNIVL